MRLAESAELHATNKAGLYRDPELGIALAWHEAQHPNAAWAERYRLGYDAAMSFLAESEQASLAEQQALEAARQRELEHAQQLAEAQKQRLEQEQRAGRNLRKLVAGLAVVAVIAAIACIVALVARHESDRLAQLAANEALNARNNEQRAEQSQKEAERALTQVESQKSEIESSLTKAEQAERASRAAEEMGRKLLYTTDMQLAPFVWKDSRSSAEQLHALLAKHVPEAPVSDRTGPADQKADLRGFEWHYYQHLLDDSATVLPGHEGTVIGTAFAPGGQIVTMDLNGQVRHWDVTARQEDEANRREPPGGPGAEALTLSSDGRLAGLISGSKVRVWDTTTGSLKFELDSTGTSVRKLIFARDGERLVVVDDKIRWLNTASGELIASVDGKFQRINDLALSADGKALAVVGHGDYGGSWSIYHLNLEARIVSTGLRNQGSISTLSVAAMSPDGTKMALGYSLSGAMTVYDLAAGRAVAHHGSAHGAPISAIAFSDDGLRIASGDTEGTIRVWADPDKLTAKSAAQLTLKGHRSGVHFLGFSNTGNLLASGSADDSARVWDLSSAGAAILPLQRTTGRGSMARYSADGRLIATTDGATIRLWDGSTGKLVRELLTAEKDQAHSVAFSPADGSLLATGHADSKGASYVALWDIDSGKKLAQLSGASDIPGFTADLNNGVVGALAFSPDGKHLLAGFGNRNLISDFGSPSPLKVWEVSSRRLIRRLEGHTGYCLSLAFTADGKRFASSGRDGKVIIWSTDSWAPFHTLENLDRGANLEGNQAGRISVEDATLSPDGKVLAMASRSGAVHLWDVETGRHLEALRGHSSSVQAVAFTPDGRTLASSGSDQTVRLWNVETRRELMQLDPGGVDLGTAYSLSFSPDGRRLLAVGNAGAAIWTTVPFDASEPEQSAAWLSRLLSSPGNFQGRIRMFSESP